MSCYLNIQCTISSMKLTAAFDARIVGHLNSDCIRSLSVDTI